MITAILTRSGDDGSGADDSLVAALVAGALAQDGSEAGGTPGDAEGGLRGGRQSGAGEVDPLDPDATPVDVSAAVLQLEDLPDGWQPASDAAAAVGLSVLCAEAPAVGDEAFVATQSMFEQEDGRAVLGSTAGDHGRIGSAERHLDALEAALGACDGKRSPQGLRLDVIDPEQLDQAADEVVGARLSGEIGGDRVTGEVRYARVGQRTMSITILTRSDDDADLVGQLLPVVAARLA